MSWDTSQMHPLLLTPEQAANALNCGRTHVYGLMKSGELESVKVGKSRRIPTSALTAYVELLRRNEAAARNVDGGR